MATLNQRVQSIGDALLNRTATQAQLTRLGDAFVRAAGGDPATATAAQKAQALLDGLFEYAIGTVRRIEGQQAGQVAQSAQAEAVNTEFAPTQG